MKPIEEIESEPCGPREAKIAAKKSPKISDIYPPPVEPSSKPDCPICRNEMEPGKAPPDQIIMLVGLVVFIGGLFLMIIPIVGWICGPIICIAAIGATTKKRKVWRCTKCNATLPRT